MASGDTSGYKDFTGEYQEDSDLTEVIDLFVENLYEYESGSNINVNNHFVPSSTNTIDIGTSALKFRNGYFSGTVNFGTIAAPSIAVDTITEYTLGNNVSVLKPLKVDSIGEYTALAGTTFTNNVNMNANLIVSGDVNLGNGQTDALNLTGSVLLDSNTCIINGSTAQACSIRGLTDFQNTTDSNGTTASVAFLGGVLSNKIIESKTTVRAPTIDASTSVKTDLITEHTASANVSCDKIFKCDVLAEKTAAAGIKLNNTPRVIGSTINFELPTFNVGILQMQVPTINNGTIRCPDSGKTITDVIYSDHVSLQTIQYQFATNNIAKSFVIGSRAITDANNVNIPFVVQTSSFGNGWNAAIGSTTGDCIVMGNPGTTKAVIGVHNNLANAWSHLYVQSNGSGGYYTRFGDTSSTPGAQIDNTGGAGSFKTKTAVITDATASNSTASGALQCTGGAAFSQSCFFSSNGFYVGTNSTVSPLNWFECYTATGTCNGAWSVNQTVSISIQRCGSQCTMNLSGVKPVANNQAGVAVLSMTIPTRFLYLQVNPMTLPIDFSVRVVDNGAGVQGYGEITTTGGIKIYATAGGAAFAGTGANTNGWNNIACSWVIF